MLILAGLVFLQGGHHYRGPHTVWRLGSHGPWLSYPPPEFGFDQAWAAEDWAKPDPPGFLPDNSRLRKSWDQFHDLYILEKKAAKQPFTEEEMNRLCSLAYFPDDWMVRSRALCTLWNSTTADVGPQRQRLIAIFCEHLNDAHYDVRTSAASGIAQLKARDKIPQVLELLKPDCEPIEVQFLAAALYRFCRGAPEPNLAGVPGVQTAAPVLASLLKSDNEGDIQCAAHVLGHIGPEAKAACQALRDALRSAESNEEQQKKEGHWIYRWGDRGTLRDIIRHALELIECWEG